MESILQYKVCVVQRQMSKENYASLRMMRERGMKIVYDLDDHLWNIPVWNPMHKVFTERKLAEGMAPCLKLCNHVTVSTPFLKQIVQDKIGGAVPVTVIENSIDLNLFVRSRRPVKRDYTVIGWAGSNTHNGDTAEAFQALARILMRRKDVRCHLMALDVHPALANQPSIAAQIKLTGFVPIWQYPAAWSNVDWDVALAPLISHDFNRAKSNVKLLEAGALGMPFIASGLDSYKSFCQGDEVLEELITTGTRSDWTRKIERLVDDVEFRQEAGRRARKRVEERFDIQAHVAQWQKVFSSV